MSVCKLFFSFTGLLIFILSCLVGWVFIPSYLKDKIAESVVIREGTDQFSRWKTTPQPLLFKTYLFNVTNPEQVLRGEKPVVKEMGPYIFKEIRWRKDINFTEQNNTVASRQFQSYEFDEEASAPLTLNDRVTTVAVHFVSMLDYLEQVDNPLQKGIIMGKLKEIFGLDSLLFNTTAREFFFEGVEFCKTNDSFAKNICKKIAEEAPTTIHANDDGSLSFSLFGHKNNTHDGLFEINTGNRNISEIGEIRRWEGTDRLNVWKTSQGDVCNMINGTDGFLLPPYRTKKSGNLFVFNTDICRSTELKFHAKETYENIPVHKYVFAESVLENVDQCFCPNSTIGGFAQENNCLFSGAIDLRPCLKASVVMTNPHFFDTAQEYSSLLVGLTPNRSLHESHVSIEPNTGSPVVAHKRVQFNTFIRPIDLWPNSKNMSTSLVPIVWVDEGLELNNNLTTLIKTSLLTPLLYVEIVHWVIFISGVVIFVGCICFARGPTHNKVDSVYN